MDESNLNLTSIDHADGAGAPPSLSSDALASTATAGGDGNGVGGRPRLPGRDRPRGATGASDDAPDEEKEEESASAFHSPGEAVASSHSDAPPVPATFIAIADDMYNMCDHEDARTKTTAASTVGGTSIDTTFGGGVRDRDSPPIPDKFVAERIASMYDDDAVRKKIAAEGSNDDVSDSDQAGAAVMGETPSEVWQRDSAGSAPRPPQYADEEAANFKPRDANAKRSGKPAGEVAMRKSPFARGRGAAVVSATENDAAADEEDAHFPQPVKDEECPDGCPEVDVDRPPSPRLTDSLAGDLAGDRPAPGVPRDPSQPTFYAVEARLVGDSSTDDSETEAQVTIAGEPSRATVYEATQVDETLSWWQKHQKVVLCTIGVAILLIGGAVVAIGVIVTRPPKEEPSAPKSKISELAPTPPPASTSSPVSTRAPTAPPPMSEELMLEPELFVERTQAPVSSPPTDPPSLLPTSGPPTSPPTFAPPPIVLGISNATYLGKLFEDDCLHTCGPYVALDRRGGGGGTAAFNPLLIKPNKGEPAKNVPEDWREQVHVWNVPDRSAPSAGRADAADSTAGPVNDANSTADPANATNYTANPANATDSTDDGTSDIVLASGAAPEEVQRLDVESQPGATAIYGDTMAVGSAWEDLLTGAVYVYGKNVTNGAWERTQKIVPDDSQVGAQFGNHVDIDRDLMVIGAYRDRERNIGSVYIYREQESQWVLEEKLEPQDDGKIYYFGMYVAIMGNRVAVGDRAYGKNTTVTRKGGFWVYDYDPSWESWNEPNRVVTNDDCDDQFGVSFAFTRDLGLLVGCPREDHDTGAVYYYQPSDAGYVLRQKVVTSDKSSWLGDLNQISVYGNVMLLGSPAGKAVYVFLLVNDVWVESEKIVGPRESKKFGNKLAMSGNRILVSSKHNAYFYELVEGTPAVDCMSHEAGKTFFESDNDLTALIALDGDTAAISKSKDSLKILFGPDGDFSVPAILGAENSSPTNYGGVAISGDVAAVGAPRDDRRNGSVRVYRSVSGFWFPSARLSPDVVVAEQQFGATVDIDGDVIVAGANDVQERGGSAYVFRHDGSGPWSSVWTQEARLLPDGADSVAFGASASVVGDTVAVGDRLYRNSGAVFVYEYEPSSRSWTRPTNEFIANGECDGNFGASLALTRDDGLLIGCPGERGDTGAVYYYARGGSGERYVLQQKIQLSGGAFNDKLGDSDQLAVDGNIMVVGTNKEAGAVHVFAKMSNAWVEVDTIESPPQSVRFGYKVALSGMKVLVASINNVHSYTLDRC